MVNTRSVFYTAWFWSVLSVQSICAAQFAEPAFENGPAGTALNKSVANYKVTADTITWQYDTAAGLFFLPLKVENSFAQGTLLAWVDDKSVIHIVSSGSLLYKITGFTDPHALYCNTQGTSVFFVSVDHAYRLDIASKRCEVILSSSGLGSGGETILGNAKYIVLSFRQKASNMIYLFDIRNKKSRLCYQTSDPISNLEVNDTGLFFYSAGRLYRYLLK